MRVVRGHADHSDEVSWLAKKKKKKKEQERNDEHSETIYSKVEIKVENSELHMATIEEFDILDSGMGSSDIRSPEVKAILPDDEEDEEDETIVERLIGLTEMFPEDVRKLSYNLGTGLTSCIKGLYGFSCSATWIMFSSSAILFAPIIFEIERAQMEEAQRTQQKQVLLGPSTAMSNMGPGMTMAPPVQR